MVDTQQPVWWGQLTFFFYIFKLADFRMCPGTYVYSDGSQLSH